MSTARDAGMAAMQSGDIQTAIVQLEVALQENPSDFEVYLYLGAAYGKAGRSMEAIKLVTQAVQLQPANAQARYNLGVAMEQGGYNDQAIQVYSQALQLQPDYPAARDAVKRLEASGNDGFGAPPSMTANTGPTEQPEQVEPTRQFAQPSAFGQQQPQQAVQPEQPATYNPLSPAQPQQPPVYNPQAPAPGGIQATQAMPPQQASPAFGRPAIPVGQPPAEAGLGSYMAPPPPAARPAAGYGSAYGARPGSYPTTPAYEDTFSIGQAFKDFIRALFKPRVLFSEMAGCDTTSSAWSLIIVYAMLILLSSAVSGMMLSGRGLGSPVTSLLTTLIGIPFYIVIWAIFATIVHLLSRAFGSSLRYGASMRCVVYSAAPFIFAAVVLGLVSPLMMPENMKGMYGTGGTMTSPMSPTFGTGGGVITSVPNSKSKKGSSKGKKPTGGSPFGTNSAGSFGSGGSPFGASGAGAGSQYRAPNGSNPFGGSSMPGSTNAVNPFAILQPLMPLLTLVFGVGGVCALWGMITLGFAISNVHEISSGAAAGVVILSVIITFVLAFGAYILFAVALAGAMMAALPH